MYFEVLLDKFLVDMLQVKIEFTFRFRLILKILPVSLALIFMIIVAILRIINLNVILTFYNRYMKSLK